MKIRSLKLCLSASLLSIAVGMIAGCGSGMSGKSSPVTSVTSVSSRFCISCHATNIRSVSPTSGVKITEQWLLSAHNTAEGAGCLDCHGFHPQYITPESCRNCHAKAHGQNGTSCAACHGGGSKELADCTTCHELSRIHINSPVAPIPDPATAGKCIGCHGATLSLKHTDPRALVAGEANPARYLNLNSTNCSVCHEAHNPLKGLGSQQRKDWEKSSHGNINGPAWTHYDFTTRSTCNSCHTAAGFAKAVGNNFTDKTALSTTTLGKQPLTCEACHSSNNFKTSIRKLSTGYVLPYAASAGASKVFPNGNWLGNSQLCVPCHAAIGGGKSIESRTISSASSPVSHYMAAAATMFVKNGFTAFTSASAPVMINGSPTATSASTNIPQFDAAGAFTGYGTIPIGYKYTYGNSLVSASDGGAINSTHRILGTPAMANDSHVGGRGLVTGGPCVTCHMGNGTANHTWGMSADSFNTVCSNCHTSEGTTTLTAANFVTAFVEEQAIPFNNARKVGFNLLSTNYHIAYSGASYPYYFKAGTRAALTASDWSRNGTLSLAQVRKLAGAAFNLQMLTREPAAFAHARTYARRLLYDTIDYLDDGAINMSVTTTAISLYPADYGITMPANASTADENLKYLKAYDRKTNNWYSAERP